MNPLERIKSMQEAAERAGMRMPKTFEIARERLEKVQTTIEAVKPPKQMGLPETILSSIFPPAGIVLGLPEGGEKVLRRVPEAFLGSVIPAVPFITGRTPVEVMLTAETERQIDIIPDVIIPPIEKQEIKEDYGRRWEEGKPEIMGGGTNISEAGGQFVDVVFPDITLPTITLPKMPDFSKLGKYAAIAAVAIGAIFLLSRRK